MPPRLNGYRRAVASVLAAVTLGILVLAALLVLVGPTQAHIGPAGVVVLAVFLGLHTFALTWLLGESPWGDIARVLDLLVALRSAPGSGADTPTGPPARTRRVPRRLPPPDRVPASDSRPPTPESTRAGADALAVSTGAVPDFRPPAPDSPLEQERPP